MAYLSVWPFHPQTGELVPVYRDAFLRGDLMPAAVTAVEQYLDTHPDEAQATLARWQQLRQSAPSPSQYPAWVAARLNVRPSISSPKTDFPAAFADGGYTPLVAPATASASPYPVMLTSALSVPALMATASAAATNLGTPATGSGFRTTVKILAAVLITLLLGVEWFISYGVSTQKQAAVEGPVFEKTENGMEAASANPSSVR